MKITTLKKGEKFYCTSDFVNDNEETLFNEGSEYECFKDGALVDENGNDTSFEEEGWDFDFLYIFHEHLVNAKDQECRKIINHN